MKKRWKNGNKTMKKDKRTMKNNLNSEKVWETAEKQRKQRKMAKKRWKNGKKTVKNGKNYSAGRKTARRAAERPLKIDPKVPNRRYRRGLQTGHQRNPGSYNKKRIFGPKSGLVARKRPQGPGGLGAWGSGVNFFPNIGKWGIQSGATICPDHTALFRSI